MHVVAIVVDGVTTTIVLVHVLRCRLGASRHHPVRSSSSSTGTAAQSSPTPPERHQRRGTRFVGFVPDAGESIVTSYEPATFPARSSARTPRWSGRRRTGGAGRPGRHVYISRRCSGGLRRGHSRRGEEICDPTAAATSRRRRPQASRLEDHPQLHLSPSTTTHLPRGQKVIAHRAARPQVHSAQTWRPSHGDEDRDTQISSPPRTGAAVMISDGPRRPGGTEVARRSTEPRRRRGRPCAHRRSDHPGSGAHRRPRVLVRRATGAPRSRRRDHRQRRPVLENPSLPLTLVGPPHSPRPDLRLLDRGRPGPHGQAPAR